VVRANRHLTTGTALVAGGALAVRLLAAAGAFAAEEPGTAASVQGFEAALNAHDVDASLSLFAEDAVVIQPRLGGLPQIYVGQQQVRWWLGGMAAQHVHVEPSGAPWLAGDSMRWSEMLSVDAFRDLGLDALAVESDMVLAQDGRIASLRIELTPQAARSIQEAPGGGPGI
jgi:hypothetical protein